MLDEGCCVQLNIADLFLHKNNKPQCIKGICIRSLLCDAFPLSKAEAFVCICIFQPSVRHNEDFHCYYSISLYAPVQYDPGQYVTVQDPTFCLIPKPRTATANKNTHRSRTNSNHKSKGPKQRLPRDTDFLFFFVILCNFSSH